MASGGPTYTFSEEVTSCAPMHKDAASQTPPCSRPWQLPLPPLPPPTTCHSLLWTPDSFLLAPTHTIWGQTTARADLRALRASNGQPSTPMAKRASYHHEQRPSPRESSAPRFEKILWKHQRPFPDNYTGHFFLESLGRGPTHHARRRNGRPRRGRRVPLSVLVLATLPITQHLAAILAFVSLFARLLKCSLSAVLLGASSLAVCVVAWAGLAAWRAWVRRRVAKALRRAEQQARRQRRGDTSDSSHVVGKPVPAAPLQRRRSAWARWLGCRRSTPPHRSPKAKSTTRAQGSAYATPEPATSVVLDQRGGDQGDGRDDDDDDDDDDDIDAASASDGDDDDDDAVEQDDAEDDWLPPLLSLSLLATVLLALSPVLRTLTLATTSDSIWALAAALFALSLALADHSLPSRPVVVVRVSYTTSVADARVDAAPHGEGKRFSLATREALAVDKSGAERDEGGCAAGGDDSVRDAGPVALGSAPHGETARPLWGVRRSWSRHAPSSSSPAPRPPPPPPRPDRLPATTSPRRRRRRRRRKTHAPRPPRGRRRLLPALSLNASICASVVLASRLPSDAAASSLLLAAFAAFALAPRWRREVARMAEVRVVETTITKTTTPGGTLGEGRGRVGDDDDDDDEEEEEVEAPGCTEGVRRSAPRREGRLKKRSESKSSESAQGQTWTRPTTMTTTTTTTTTTSTTTTTPALVPQLLLAAALLLPTSLCGLWRLSRAAGVASLLAALVVSLVCPAWLWWCGVLEESRDERERERGGRSERGGGGGGSSDDDADEGVVRGGTRGLHAKSTALDATAATTAADAATRHREKGEGVAASATARATLAGPHAERAPWRLRRGGVGGGGAIWGWKQSLAGDWDVARPRLRGEGTARSDDGIVCGPHKPGG